MHAASLIAAYAAVVLAPLALAWAQGRPPRPFWDEIASGLGMAAFAILLVEFVLSGRYRGVSGRIGMDVTMRFHQLVARTALAFVLLHPFLYATPFGVPLPWDPTGQATLGLGIEALATGMAAWVALPAFVLLSIFRDQLPYRYETWRWLHLLGAVLIALMVTHHALEAGRYAADPLLAGFWLLLLAAAIGSLAYARIVAPFRRAARPYRVASVRRLASRTWELTVEPTRGAALEFRAGQFVWLKIGHGPLSLAENPFSISSAPAHRPAVQFVIKEAGDLTDRIGAVPVGTPVHLDGPHGNLTLDGRSGAGIALIAGGVGIAPLLGILRQLHADGDRRPVILLYGNRHAGQIVYKDELARLAEAANVRVIHVLSEPAPGWTEAIGRIDRATLERAFGFEGASDWLYLVCGPPAMLEVVEDTLLAGGVPGARIVSERFNYD